MQNEPAVPVLQAGEKVIGSAYLTEDGEIVFSRHGDATEIVLVKPQHERSGVWAPRVRPHLSSKN